VSDDELDIARLRLEPVAERRVTPRRVEKRRKHFVMLPYVWVEALINCKHAGTWCVAVQLVYLDWKNNHAPIKVANTTLDGVTRWSKNRALLELEDLGLVSVERRPKKSPIVRLNQ
jgi:hypothetical protein